MPQSFCAVQLHVVFSTKNRTPHINPTLAPKLYGYIHGIIGGGSGTLLTAGGMPDHVHLLIALGRETTIADLVRLVKSNSSKWIHEMFQDQRDFAWQNGYGAFSVSRSQEGVVRHYIGAQEEHHKVHSFQDEYRELLRRHEIEWDERYVWD